MDRTILHCDLNNFFASVAVLDNPTIKNCPIAVTGSTEERHGIVLAKNELAKSFGVVTAEATWQAKKKCPELVCVPPNYHRYNEVSMAVREIYLRYSDMVEPFGIDECWLDVTGSRLLFGSGTEIAEKIRAAVKREIGVTVSVGVSFNKVFAKLGSDLKKPDAVTEISRENYKEKVWPLPADVLLGVGRSTKKQLDSLGIFTVGEIAAAGKEVLKNRMGKMGEQLYLFASGEDTSPVAAEQPIPKSVGRTTTLPADLNSADEAWPVVLSLAEDISANLRRHGLYCGAVQAHIRTFDLNTKEFQAALTAPTQSSLIMANKCMELINDNFGFSVPLRSIGFRAINLKNSTSAYQTDIFTDFKETEEREEVEDRIFEIKKKYGKGSIVRGTTVNTHIRDRDE
ncbi:MAG: DNA polymerase IV [Clostridia bacterium]|nr:DNA polymerase IV [Clostridia bacterium]